MTQRRTQNSDVVIVGDLQTNMLDFYGVINDILELCYLGWHSVCLFSCDWFGQQGIQIGSIWPVLMYLVPSTKMKHFYLLAKLHKYSISKIQTWVDLEMCCKRSHIEMCMTFHNYPCWMRERQMLIMRHIKLMKH